MKRPALCALLALAMIWTLHPLVARASELQLSEEGLTGWSLDVIDESSSGLTLEFRLHSISESRNELGSSFHMEDAGRAAQPGDPDLPALSRLLICPPGMKARLTLLAEDLQVLGKLQPSAAPDPASDRPDSRPVALPLVKRAGVWPETTLRIGERVAWLGRAVAAVDLFPVRWDEANSQLELSTRILFRVEWEPADRIARPRGASIHEASRELLTGLALNPSQLDRSRREVDAPLAAGHYVVVYPDAAFPELGGLLEWRRQQGWELRLIPLSEVGGEDADHESIYMALRDEFEAAPFDYLLLVGDIDRYPGGIEAQFNLDAGFIPGGQYAESGWGARCNSPYCIASDHLYSTLEGDDYFADVLVGRLSVDNANDVLTMANRIVSYERDPFTALGAEWYRRGLMIYEVAGAMSRRETKLSIRDNLLERLDFVQVDTVYSHYWLDPVSPNVITSAVNNGLSVVNYRGYGFRTQWYGPNFDIYDADNLQNIGRWPLVTSIVCGGGDFACIDDDPCFGEAWLRSGSNPAEPAGAIGFIAPTEEDTHTQWNNIIDEGIYHGLTNEGLRSLGAMMDRGKIELWLGYPNARQWGTPCYNVPFYFHCYNLLGDPGTRLRVEEPMSIVCDTPAALSAGSLLLDLQVTDDEGFPLPGVAACLYHGGQDLAIVARSDDAGRLVLEHESLPAGYWTLTLHGDGLIPVQRELEANTDASHLVVESWTLGEASGDGLPSPGDQLELHPRLREAGSEGTATPGELRLSCADSRVTVPDTGVELPATSAGSIVEPESPLEFQLGHGFAHGEELTLRLELDGLPIGEIALLVHHTELVVLGVTGDLPFDPGYAGGLVVELEAAGLAGGALISRLVALDSRANVTQEAGGLIEILPGESTTLAGFAVELEVGMPRGSELPFQIRFWQADADPQTDPVYCSSVFTLRAGDPGPLDPLGPDAGGYLAIHSQDEHELAPAFEWESILGTGLDLNVRDQEGDQWSELPDGISRQVALPFEFTYYGESYTEITVCSNGWIAFGDTGDRYYTAINTPIPGAQGPAAMVAVYWTDLYNAYNSNNVFGSLLVEHREAAGEFVIEWNGFRPVSGPYMINVQLVLRDPLQWPTATGDGELLMHLDDISTSNGTNGVTIGIEQPDELGGLQVVFNDVIDAGGQPIEDGCSLLFTPIDTDTALEPAGGRPLEFALLNIAPNPFNPVTRIQVELGEATQLELDLFDLNGRLLRSIVSDLLPAGEHRFRLDASALASGLYLVRMKAGQQIECRKITLLK